MQEIDLFIETFKRLGYRLLSEKSCPGGIGKILYESPGRKLCKVYFDYDSGKIGYYKEDRILLSDRNLTLDQFYDINKDIIRQIKIDNILKDQ